MKLYHGSPVKNIKEFNLDQTRFEPVEGSGIYFTIDYKIARGYAGSEGSVYLCLLKNNAIFDATNKDEFTFLIELMSNSINYNLLSLDFINETINSFIDGQYKITDDSISGIFWQFKNLLLNDEKFTSLNDFEEKLTKLKEFIKEYIDQHSVLKYFDKNLGLIFLAKDPSIIKIIEEIEVGSEQEETFL